MRGDFDEDELDEDEGSIEALADRFNTRFMQLERTEQQHDALVTALRALEAEMRPFCQQIARDMGAVDHVWLVVHAQRLADQLAALLKEHGG